MIEVKTVREWACRLCGAVERLRKDEPEPTSCPRCMDGKPSVYSGKANPDSWSA